jgi:methylated-DNA-protein-cysteine methyltransferase-like protein
MVGWALTQSHKMGVDIPAHRVVNRNGELTGRNHFGHPDLMGQLLESEGVAVTNNRVENFPAHFWHPEEGL